MKSLLIILSFVILFAWGVVGWLTHESPTIDTIDTPSAVKLVPSTMPSTEEQEAYCYKAYKGLAFVDCLDEVTDRAEQMDHAS